MPHFEPEVWITIVAVVVVICVIAYGWWQGWFTD